MLRGAKVLLAEDEHINRVLIETILKQLGVDVTSVGNGRQAVARPAAVNINWFYGRADG